MIDFTPREISGILKAALLMADADGWNDYTSLCIATVFS
jgi:hypothetical protein